LSNSANFMRFMKTFLLALILCGYRLAAAEALPGGGSGPVVINSDFISRLMEEARGSSPTLKAADSRTRAAKENVKSIRTWEDPMASFGGSVYSEKGFSPSEDGNLVYGIEQKLPLWGKPKLARRAAETQASVREADANFREHELRSTLTKALIETALAEEEVSIGEQDLAWLEVTKTATQSRYRAGQASVADTLQIENEAAKRSDTLKTARTALAHERFTLNRLLNRDPGAAWPPLKLPGVVPPIPLSQKLVSLALENEPKLKILERQIKEAAANTELVRKSRYPDISLGIEGRQYSGDGGFRSGMFTLKFPIPWTNREKYRADYERERELQNAAERDREEQVLMVKEELHHLAVGIEASRREALLNQNEISVRATQALKSRELEWENGRAAFRDVLDARRMLLESELMAARAAAEEHRMLAEMLLWTGLPTLETLLPLAHEPSLLPEHGGDNAHE
jgi:outer membrane protein TolC